jgi:hypothetical protein
MEVPAKGLNGRLTQASCISQLYSLVESEEEGWRRTRSFLTIRAATGHCCCCLLSYCQLPTLQSASAYVAVACDDVNMLAMVGRVQTDTISHRSVDVQGMNLKKKRLIILGKS